MLPSGSLSIALPSATYQPRKSVIKPGLLSVSMTGPVDDMPKEPVAGTNLEFMTSPTWLQLPQGDKSQWVFLEIPQIQLWGLQG